VRVQHGLRGANLGLAHRRGGLDVDDDGVLDVDQ
jgi:hypothetical protein